MSEEIALAAADRAAELAAIRSRAERLLYEYGEDWRYDHREDWPPEGDDAPYLASAWLFDGISRILDLDEPDDDERAALRELVQAQHDRRVLLARLDEVTAAAEAVLAEYSRADAELHAARAVVAEARLFAGGARPEPDTPKARLIAALAAYDATWPAED